MRTLLLAILICTGCASMGVVGVDDSFEVRVQELEVPAIVSGVVAAYVVIHGVERGERPRTLHLPYMALSQRLPELNADCEFETQGKAISGIAGSRTVTNLPVSIVVEFQCSPGTP